VAVGVLTAEVAVVPLLVLAPLGGFVLAAVLLGGFAVAIGRALRRGERGPCRCFGASSAPLGPRHVVRSAGLGLVALTGAAVLASGSASVPVLATGSDLLRAAHPAGVALAATVAGVLTLLTVVLDDLAALLGPAPDHPLESP
jgi:hypothetical protein